MGARAVGRIANVHGAGHVVVAQVHGNGCTNATFARVAGAARVVVRAGRAVKLGFVHARTIGRIARVVRARIAVVAIRNCLAAAFASAIAQVRARAAVAIVARCVDGQLVGLATQVRRTPVRGARVVVVADHTHAHARFVRALVIQRAAVAIRAADGIGVEDAARDWRTRVRGARVVVVALLQVARLALFGHARVAHRARVVVVARAVVRRKCAAAIARAAVGGADVTVVTHERLAAFAHPRRHGVAQVIFRA